MRTAALVLGLAAAFAAGWLSAGAGYEDAPSPALPAQPSRAERPAASPQLEVAATDANAADVTVAVTGSPRAASEATPGDGAPGRCAAQVDAADDAHAAVAREMIARVAPLLAKGRAAHVDLWRQLEAFAGEERFEFVYGESQHTAAGRYLWRRFLVEHEAEVAAFFEEAYRVLLEEPPDPEDRSTMGLEMLDEDLGTFLVEVLPPARFELLRDRLRRLVRETPRGQGHGVRELDHLLVAWAQASSPAEAARQFRHPDASPAELSAFALRAPAAAVEDDALATILVRVLDEQPTYPGWEAFDDTLSRFCIADLSLDAAGLERVDARVVAFSATCAYNNHARRLWRYASLTGRGTWPAIESLIDKGLAGSGRAPSHFALIATVIRSPPPRGYVEQLADRVSLPAKTKAALRAYLAER
jgi:hypothetical protein